MNKIMSEPEKWEIMTSYKGAKDKLGQVRILADLYDCTTREIQAVLIDGGVDPAEVDLRKAPRKGGATAKGETEKSGSKMNGIINLLRAELVYIESRKKYLPEQIAKLQWELGELENKERAVDQAIILLTGGKEGSHNAV